MTPAPSLRRARLRAGIELEYAEQGPRGGPTLLLLHGLTDSWRSFEPLLPLMLAHWHVIALSQRGHGGSDKPPGPYRTHDFAADAAALARELDLGPMVVVGHSMGSSNALRLALDAPELVEGLVLAGAFASYADKGDLVGFHREVVVPLADPVPRALAAAFQRDTIEGAVAPGLLDTMVDESLRVPAHVWRGALAGLMDDHFSAEVHRVQVPTLIAWGDCDRFVPAADGERLWRAMPRAQLSIYPDTGHAVHWEQPRRFARELVAFVAGLRQTLAA